MKIRTGFVTNSSSSSFLILLNRDKRYRLYHLVDPVLIQTPIAARGREAILQDLNDKIVRDEYWHRKSHQQILESGVSEEEKRERLRWRDEWHDRDVHILRKLQERVERLSETCEVWMTEPISDEMGGSLFYALDQYQSGNGIAITRFEEFR